MLSQPTRKAAVRLLVPLAMAFAWPLTVSPAAAESLTITVGSGHHGTHHGTHHGDRGHRGKSRHGAREHHGAHGHHDRHRRHDRHTGAHHNRGHHAESRRRGHDEHGGYTTRDCRRVTKEAYHDGRLAKIAGKLCYDRHGKPYIVKGSRHVVGYYD